MELGDVFVRLGGGLGKVLGHLARLLGHLGRLLGCQEAVLDRSWATFGRLEFVN